MEVVLLTRNGEEGVGRRKEEGRREEEETSPKPNMPSARLSSSVRWCDRASLRLHPRRCSYHYGEPGTSKMHRPTLAHSQRAQGGGPRIGGDHLGPPTINPGRPHHLRLIAFLSQPKRASLIAGTASLTGAHSFSRWSNLRGFPEAGAFRGSERHVQLGPPRSPASRYRPMVWRGAEC